METAATRIALRLWALLVVCFLWIPLVVIGVYAFNESNIQSWPISGWAFHWGRTTTAARGLFFRSRRGTNRRPRAMLFSADGVLMALVQLKRSPFNAKSLIAGSA